VIVAPWLLTALPAEAIGSLLAGAVLYTGGVWVTADEETLMTRRRRDAIVIDTAIIEAACKP
jgi:hypothetical protein